MKQTIRRCAKHRRARTSKPSPRAQAYGNSPGCGGATAELGGESGREGPKSSFQTEFVRLAELHWYEATGVGQREFKIKRYLD